MKRFLLLPLILLLFSGCHTIPIATGTPQTDALIVDIQTGQTGIVSDATALQGMSDALIDIAKDIGNKTLTVYVDKNALLVKSLNDKVTVQTVTINDMAKSHIADGAIIANLTAEIKKLTPYKYRFIIACLIIGVIILLQILRK